MAQLSPGQFSKVSESKDYGTGYRTVSHDIDVPESQPHEPTGVRSQARETGTNRWMITTTLGPHHEKDESGSYYKHVGTEHHEGPIGSARTIAKRQATAAWKGVIGARKK